MDLTRNHYQRNSSWNAPFTFSGKEKDAETGYGYVKKLRFFSSLAFGNEKQVFHYAHCLRRFGARYYDSGLSVLLSVDPLSDKYPTLSPYTYCANNPIMMVDPDGRLIIDPELKARCPEFYKFMKTEFYNFVTKNEAIMKPLMHYSGLSREEIEYAVTDGQGPRLMIGGEAAGSYVYSPSGGNIPITEEQAKYLEDLDRSDVSKFKKNVALFFTVQTILHELVHYGRQKQGFGEEIPNLPHYYDIIDGIKYFKSWNGADIGHLFEAELYFNSRWNESCETYSDAENVVRRLTGTPEENKLPTWP